MKEPYILITVLYDGGHDGGHDKKLIGIAKKHKGKESGSGYSFIGKGTRDISFYFDNLKKAFLFYKDIKRLKKSQQIFARLYGFDWTEN